MAEGTKATGIHEVPSPGAPTGAPTGAAAAPGASTPARVLLIDSDELVRDSVARLLGRAGYEVCVAQDPADAAVRLVAGPCDLVVIDPPALAARSGTGDLLGEARSLRADVPMVVMRPHAGMRAAIEASRREGAPEFCEFVTKPFERDELLLAAGRVLERARLARENAALREAAESHAPPRPLVGHAPAIEALRAAIERAAASEAPVLIHGEPGTGKQTAARLIHAASARRGRSMLAVNCATVDGRPLASAIFGHEPGAWPGAADARAGRLELAAGGTLLLKHVAEMPPDVQVRLLRALRDGTFERLGGRAAHHAGARLIATAARPLREAVAAGSFREDLAARLGAIQIHVSPLRERREDVPEVVRSLLHRIARRDGQPFRHVEPEAMRLLQKYPWPGNVRELGHVLERAAMLEPQPGVLRAATIAPWLCAEAGPGSNGAGHRQTIGGDPLDRLPLAEVEKRVILDTLAKFEGHRAKTATALGIGIRTLGIKLKKWRQEGELAECPFV